MGKFDYLRGDQEEFESFNRKPKKTKFKDKNLDNKRRQKTQRRKDKYAVEPESE